MPSEMINGLRDTLNKRLGEIIEDLFVEDALREKFDEAGGRPAKYENMPTGAIALKMAVIDEQTRDALLIAQAAERTLRAAESIERGDTSGIRNPGDSIFQHIGSANDAPALVEAQSTWQLAETYRYVIRDELDGKFDDPSYPGSRLEGVGDRYVDALRQASADLFKASAGLLAGTPHAGLAVNMQSLNAYVALSISVHPTTTAELADSLIDKLERTKANPILGDTLDPDGRALKNAAAAGDSGIDDDIQAVREIAARIDNPEPAHISNGFARAARALLNFIGPARFPHSTRLSVRHLR